MSSHRETLHILKELEKITEVVDTTQEIIRAALDSGFPDFEDAIQYHCAKSTKKTDAIITRNPADYRQSKIPILSPEEVIGLLSGI